jgi:formiminoglutamate deiminase
MFFRHALLPGGWAQNVRISIADGIITAVEPDAGAGQGIALPGVPNLHSHAFQRAIAGLTEHRGGGGMESFWTWRDMMYRFALHMSPEDVQAVATQAFVEMLEGGFTSVAEFHYLHHAPDGAHYTDIAEMAARIAAAAEAAGIDLLLLPVFYAHAGFGGKPPAEGQRRFINNLESYGRIYERCRQLSPTGIAPHSLRAVTPDELAALTTLASPDTPIHIHISEQTGEVAECLAWSGARPIQWLLGHANVAPNWCLVHATHTDAAERAGMAASDAVVGLCPITEANLGDGIFPAHNYKGPTGIGSDSNVLISVAEELRMLEYSQRLAARQRNVLAGEIHRATATAMLASAVAGGAQAMGMPAGIAPGAPANLFTLAGDAPDIALAQAVFATRSPQIQNVWVRGRQIVSDGRHPLAERAKRDFDAVVKKLLA